MHEGFRFLLDNMTSRPLSMGPNRVYSSFGQYDPSTIINGSKSGLLIFWAIWPLSTGAITITYSCSTYNGAKDSPVSMPQLPWFILTVQKTLITFIVTTKYCKNCREPQKYIMEVEVESDRVRRFSTFL